MASIRTLHAFKSPRLRQRARRIGDEEWEHWRTELTGLYIEEDLSRKDIVDYIAKEHRFVINEKQLKHRFHKWQVKKYISSQDMMKMLAFRNRHRGGSAQIKFHYRGHEVENERLERASKRQKRALPDTPTLPSYIKAHFSPCQLPTGRTLVDLDNWSNTVSDDTIRSFIKVAGLDFSEESPDIVSSVDVGSLMVPIESSEEMKNYATSEGIAVVDRRNIRNAFESEVFWSRPLSPWELVDFGLSSVREAENHSSEVKGTGGPHTTQFLQAMSASPDCVDWLSTPPNRSHGCDGSLDQPPACISKNQGLQIGPGALEEGAISGLDLHQANPLQTHEHYIKFSRAVDIDKNDIAYSSRLQMLYSRLVASLDKPSMISSTFCDHAPQVVDTLKSVWLSGDLNDIFCFGHHKALDNVLRSHGHLAESSFQVHDVFPPVPDTDFSDWFLDLYYSQGVPGTSELGINFDRHVVIVSIVGTVRVHLRTIPKQYLTVSTLCEPCTLRISFMPAARLRTVGMSIDLLKKPDNYAAPLIRYQIKTFNVVPQESAIIQYVLCNDLRGVQGLFDRGEAPPQDVDPIEFSLLSYTINAGGLEVFLLLLQGGATTENCDHYGSVLDAIWAICFQYIDQISHRKAQSGVSVGITNFDHCVRMVDAASDRDYDIEESVCYNSDRASVLFEMNDCLEEPYLQSPEKVLNYLINKGYDLENRNDGGLTPLLHTVASFRPQSIKCIRTFIRRGADIHVIDPEGHGALHLALNGPYTLHKWGTQSHLRPAGANITDNLWDLKTVHQTEDDGLAGCSSDQEDQREVLSYCGRRQYQGYVLTDSPFELENALLIINDFSPDSVLGALHKDEEENPRSDKDMSD